MTDELIFYTYPMSRGRIVRWMLEEIGHPYRTELLDFGTTMKAPEYLSLNPMGKSAGDTARRYGRDGMRRHLRLSRTPGEGLRARPMSGRSENVPEARISPIVSFDDFRVIRDNLAGGNRTTRDRLIPYCMFTDPPLARMGLSESEVKVLRCVSQNCR
jgi:hypothetical protein